MSVPERILAVLAILSAGSLVMYLVALWGTGNLRRPKRAKPRPRDEDPFTPDEMARFRCRVQNLIRASKP